jgi:hydrogenase nickel insertion protein HypA
VHELSIAAAIVDTATRHAARRRVTAVHLRVGHLRQVVPASLAFSFELVSRGTPCAGARLEQQVVPARLRCEGCGREWALETAAFRCPTCGAAGATVVSGEELEVESIDRRGTGGGMHRVKVREVEDALDANNTIARANRADFDAHGVTVVNLMSAPGGRKDDAARAAARRRPRRSASRRARGRRAGVARRRSAGEPARAGDADQHRPRIRWRVPPRCQHVRSALRAVPLDEIDLLVIENVGNLVCPAEFHVGEDARVMVAAVTEGEDKPPEVPPHVPHVRSRARQQD